MLKKTDKTVFDWFNFESPPETDTFRVELYFDDFIIDSDDEFVYNIQYNAGKDRLADFALALMHPDSENVLIGQPHPEGKWDEMPFDLMEFTGDFLGINKSKPVSEPSAVYLQVLKDAGIEDGYKGYCTCTSWPEFSRIIIEGVLHHVFDYSLYIFDLNFEYVLYFHNTFEIGIYYKNPDFIIRIEDVADEYNFKIRRVK